MEREELDDEFNDEDLDREVQGGELGEEGGDLGSDGANGGGKIDSHNADSSANIGANTSGSASANAQELGPDFGLDMPELARKDKTLQQVLDMMDGDYAPIIPDAVTEYYLAKNGFESLDVKIKRLLALATQKFISDVAQDAYEYSRIRNSSAVYNLANPLARAKQLLQGQQFAQQVPGEDAPQQHSSSNAGNQQGKVVLTMEDLSSALGEYGVNASRPEFYR